MGKASVAMELGAMRAVASGRLIVLPDGRVWRRTKRGLRRVDRMRHLDFYPSFVIDGCRVCAHRLVFRTFRGPIPDGYEVDHLNTAKNDNRPENLEAVTHSENIRRQGKVKRPVRYDYQMRHAALLDALPPPSAEEIASARSGYHSSVASFAA